MIPIFLTACLFMSSNWLFALPGDASLQEGDPTGVRASESGPEKENVPDSAKQVLSGSIEPSKIEPSIEPPLESSGEGISFKTNQATSADESSIINKGGSDGSTDENNQRASFNMSNTTINHEDVKAVNSNHEKTTDVNLNFENVKNQEPENTDVKATSIATVEGGSIKITLKDVTQKEADFSKNLVNQLAEKSPVLQKNEIYNANKQNVDAFGNKLQDTDAMRKLALDGDVAIRRMCQNVLPKVKTQLTTIAKMSRKLLSKDEQEAYKRVIAEEIIETQLINVFGKSRFSDQVNVKLSPEKQEALVKAIMNDPNLFKDEITPEGGEKRAITDNERLQFIANHGDAVMNAVSGDIATFKTTIDPESGDCTSTISKDGITSTSVVSAAGKRISKTFVIADSAEGKNDGMTFTTSIDGEGNLKTTVKRNNDPSEAELNAEDADTINGAQGSYQSAVNAKTFLKAAIYAGTKVAPALAYCALTAPVNPAGIASTAAIELAKASTLGLVKVYSLANGEPWSAPAMVDAGNRIAASLGDSRGTLSGSNNRVLRTGSLASKVWNRNMNEQEDPEETYYTWLNVADEASKKIFAEGSITGGTLGSAKVALNSLGTGVSNVASAIYNAPGNAVGRITGANQRVNFVSDTATAVKNAVVNTATDAYNVPGDAVGYVAGETGLAPTYRRVNFVSDSATALYNAPGQAVGAVAKAVGYDAVTNNAGSVPIMTNTANAISTAYTGLKTSLSNAVGYGDKVPIMTTVANTISGLKTMAESAYTGIVNTGAATATASGVVQPAQS